jgi:RNA polymerase sigma-70 factor, ECF subfamily
MLAAPFLGSTYIWRFSSPFPAQHCQGPLCPISVDAVSSAPPTSPSAHPAAPNPERWVDEHGDCLMGYAVLRVRKPDIAEDLVQETLLAAWRSRERFRGQSSERTWLVGILKNKIADHFRRLGREQNFTDLEFLSDECPDRFEDNYWIHERGPQEWRPQVAAASGREEFWQAFRDCLRQLPPRVADVFMLREMDEQDTPEICRSLGITPANLWVMLHRARLALRQCLGSNWFGEGRDPAS